MNFGSDNKSRIFFRNTYIKIGKNYLLNKRRVKEKCKTTTSTAICYELRECQFVGLGARRDFSVQCQTPTILLWLERNFSQELTKAEGHK